MKRTIIAIAALGTFSFAIIGANAQPIQQDTAIEFVQDQRKEVKFEELPEQVKQAFDESQYSEWEVSKAYEVPTEEGTQYELTISDGSQSGTLTFDEEGNMVQ